MSSRAEADEEEERKLGEARRGEGEGDTFLNDYLNRISTVASLTEYERLNQFACRKYFVSRIWRPLAC